MSEQSITTNISPAASDTSSVRWSLMKSMLSQSSPNTISAHAAAQPTTTAAALSAYIKIGRILFFFIIRQ